MRRNTVAYVALFVALSGTAYAARQPLFAGDAAGGDLAGTYPNPTIKPCAADQVLKFSGGAWACASDQAGGPISGLVRVVESSPTTASPTKLVVATCPSGKRAIGSGGSVSESTGFADPQLAQIVPSDAGTVPGTVSVYAERGAAAADPTEPWTATAFAVCAD